MQEFINPLADLGDKVTKLTTELGMKAFGNADEVGAAAVDYLRVVRPPGVRLLLGAHGQGRAGEARQSGDPFYTAKLATARFYFAKLLPETAGADPQRARRPGAADGDGRGAVLKSLGASNRKETTHEASRCAGRRCWRWPRSRRCAQATPVGLWKTIDDDGQDREVAGAHRRGAAAC